MNQETLYRLVAVGIAILVAFPVHEFSHALAAYRLGDSTARYQGRLTLNPIVHFDPLGGGILVLGALFGGVFIGWAKPTPVNPYNLQGGTRGEALVAAAGPLSNLVLASLVAIPLRIIASSPEMLAALVRTAPAALAYNVAVYFVLINIFLFIFNLLPIPPLDGWRVLMGLVTPRTAYSLRQVEQYGFIVLLAFIFVGGRILGPIGFGLLDFLTGGAGILPVSF